MRLFNECKGYATQKNAITKLLRTLKAETIEELDAVAVWSVGVNSAGRFYPIVHRLHNDPCHFGLAHYGIATC